MLAPWKKSYDHLNNVLKSTDIIWSTKVHLAKADFSSTHVKMWDLGHKESWTLKNWCFWSVVLEKTLGGPLDCKEIKPVKISLDLREISPEYLLEGLMLKLKLQYFGHLMQRTDSLENTLMLRKIEGRRRGQQRKRCWMASPTQWTWVWASSGRW